MNKKNEDIESQSEPGTNLAAYGMICNTIPHPKEGNPILIVYSNKNMKWDI